MVDPVGAWGPPSAPPYCSACSLAAGAPPNYEIASGVAWTYGVDTYSYTCAPGYYGPPVVVQCQAAIAFAPWGTPSPSADCQRCSLADALANTAGLTGIAALPSTSWSNSTWTYDFRCAAGSYGPAVPWTCDSTTGSWSGAPLSCTSCASSLYQAVPATDGFVGPTAGTSRSAIRKPLAHAPFHHACVESATNYSYSCAAGWSGATTYASCDEVTGIVAGYVLPVCVPSQSPTPSQSPSQTPSISFTSSPTPTARPEQAVIDNTIGRTAPFGGSVTVDPTSQFGVSFSFVEGDSSCGPGRYRLTSLGLGLSSTSAAALQVRIRIYCT